MYHDMNKILEPGQVGIATLEKFEVSKEASMRSGFRGDGVRDGEYVKLLVGNDLMMSNTDMERRSNFSAVKNANGDVLIAGLGIGLIIVPMFENPEVKSITVIEKYKDVIELIETQLRKCPGSEKLTVIWDDIFDWKVPKGTVYDCIYFDIWPDICTDNIEEIKKLHSRFKSKRNMENDRGWMDSWMYERLKSLRRREKQGQRYW